MAIELSDFGLEKIDSDEVIGRINTASAMLSAGTNVGTVPMGGLSFPRVSGIEAFAVAEGGEKIATGSTDFLVMDNRKLVATTVFTEEAYSAKPRVVDTVWDIQPGAVAKSYDEYTFGLKDKPAEWATTPTFGDATVEVEEGADASVSLDDILASTSGGAGADALIVTSAMLSYLRRQRFAATGARVFEIVATSKTEGTIDGMPYFVINSSIAKGAAITRARLFTSLTPFNDPNTGSPYRLKDQGTITDSDDNEHNLTATNKFALMYEAMSGITFDPAEFPVFGVAGSVTP